MPLQEFSDAELYAKGLELGVVAKGEELPRNMRSRVAAALIEERRAADRPEPPAEPMVAKQITVQGSQITVDGKPFPWLVARVPMDIGLAPDGSGTVRLTLLADSVQVLKPKTDSTESE